MRIIAGEFRGRRLLGPLSDTTRPITDRAKQSVFDTLAPTIESAVVYDCFAGTGSMGLECLSRGASKAIFFESDRPAVTLLRQNIATLAVQDRSQIIPGDLFRWFDSVKPPETKANLIFLDPPYRFVTERVADLQRLASYLSHHFAPGGTLIFRHDAGDEIKGGLPPFIRYELKKYSNMAVELLTVN